ncbi:NADP-dependent malic enzyme [Ostreibacterium oceani]|uniref:NADP-dependent malic enzyme n=1 Tax=Ostreibacterium oceani TaxID=2654998 RepID=A0A6N7F2K1_9GAMM|nr:NADP-dependent malic enzyme [Ostreibacterium oceani]MPV86096.1 NADP-dependent malic enzyme [Ostreibacterium oceani]
MSDQSEDFKQQSLKYHRLPKPGKVAITATKSMSNQRDLALAYSPGVAYACEAIVDDPAEAASLTARQNLVAVITNGTAVLGLGNIGPLASKPVMEGKGVLFKKFAGIDVFDIEINETDPDKFIDIVASLEPTFGGINLEDIKAPECFEIEEKLKQRMGIPVFHDDQHGTAIIATAALLNALSIQGKTVDEVRIVASGAGAAGMACLDLFVSLGVPKKNITVCDSKGVIYIGREGADQGRKKDYAIDSPHRTLADALVNADVFLGVSQAGLVTPEMVQSMAPNPLILALANPVPEIMPDVAKAARPDVMIATGRSDFPNQVNNVLCFPYIFRGALDVGATEINEAMKLACVKAIADLAKAPVGEEVLNAYGVKLEFGPNYIIPTPFDPRLISVIPAAVAKAAMESGVAARPLDDLAAYEKQLEAMIDKTGMSMRPVFTAARTNKKRILLTEGEEERVLFATKAIIEEGIGHPVLIGRPKRIQEKLDKLGLHMAIGKDFELIDQQNNVYYQQCIKHYHKRSARFGVDPHAARVDINTRPTILGAILVDLGLVDTMLCGTIGRFEGHLESILHVLKPRTGVIKPATLSMLITSKGTVFVSDTNVTENPTCDEIVNIAELAVLNVKKFGVIPKIAMLSHSNFGSKQGREQVDKMARAREILKAKYPELMVEGEMQADAALSHRVRHEVFPDNELTGNANILIMPNLDAANIGFNLMKVVAADGVTIGPMMMGLEHPVHILSRSATVRRIINMAAIAAVDAQDYIDMGFKP